MKIKIENKFNRALVIILAVIVALFAVYNVVWITYREVRYKPFVEGFYKQYGVYHKDLDGVYYEVFKPKYLSFGGNLTVTDYESNEGIIIWPKFPSGYDYAVDIITGTEEDEDGIANLYTVMSIDEHGNYIDKSFGEKEKNILNERKDDVERWIRLSHEMWEYED